MNLVSANILVIAGSGIGNVLLATPIMRSLRRAFPEAKIDALVPRGRGGILEGNPDINEVVEVSRHEGFHASIRFLRRMWRHYDLSLSTQAGDRSIINSWIGARTRYSHDYTESPLGAWRKLLLHGRVGADFTTHVMLHGLRLLDSLAIPQVRELVPPTCPTEAEAALDALLPFTRDHQPYAVMHLYPRSHYKCWTAHGWVAAMRHVIQHGLPVVLTGGGDPHERHYVETVLAKGVGGQVVDLTGQISLPQVSALLGRCALYIGPDTGITHLASAQGAPTVALFGPTDPVYWGPWPAGYTADRSPYMPHGCQRIRNVFVIQRDQACTHRDLEGCEDDPHRPSRCMRELDVDVVLNAIDEMLETSPAPSGDSQPPMPVVGSGPSNESTRTGFPHSRIRA